MFENLTDKIESAFAFFNKITRLDEKQADEGLRKIRQALLESDVALSVTKKFIEDVRPKIICLNFHLASEKARGCKFSTLKKSAKT